MELPEERLTADFNEDLILVLSPDIVGPSITRNSGIIGEGVDMSLEHLGDMRPSSLVFRVTQRLLYTKWRDPGEEPKLHLFGQLKRITKQWLDTCLVCKGGTYTCSWMGCKFRYAFYSDRMDDRSNDPRVLTLAAIHALIPDTIGVSRLRQTSRDAR